MRRRDFIKVLAAGAAFPISAQLSVAGPPRRKIAVVGAGLAGLAAAYELRRRGHWVTVFEARSRPGGRVETLRAPFTGGQHAEAGAMFIPSSHDLVVKYARAFGLTLRPIPSRLLSPMLYLHGRRIAPMRPRGYDWPVRLSAAERGLALDQIADRYVGPVLAELGDPRAPGWPPPALRKYDAVSLGQLLKDRGASAGAIELLRLNDSDLTGDGIDTVSALMILRETKYYETANYSYTIAGGSDRLPHAFAARLTNAIKFDAPVVKIRRKNGTAAITFLERGTPQTMNADLVVCAVPLSVLSRIEFEPALPEALRRAQNEVGYTSVTRVYVQTGDRPWETAGLGVAAYTDLASMTIVNSTFDQRGRAGILHAYATGARGRTAAALSEPDRVAAAIADMEKLFPGLRKNLLASASKAWDRDEWSRGAFAWFRPGQMFELPPRLAQPVEGMVFAGEHSSNYPGWMQGALESGLRAADAIVRRR